MSLSDKLDEIAKLQQAIEGYGKLSSEVLNKINYKFRLEWNYYSNRMEGNTLTLEETKSVMTGIVTVNDKPLKDVLEMQGHDNVVSSIIKMGKGELNISESKIREIHKAIMYEDSPIEREKTGKWKQLPNHIINLKGEKFEFAAPADVPEQMHALINWLNSEKEKIERKKPNAANPVLLAFQFHLRYLTIHPFYDGNGRTARILTNLILISYGFPPIYIKEKEKGIYYQYLAEVQGYGADASILYSLMCGYLIRSLQIAADAAAGKEIEEPDDIDKEIELFKRSLDRSKERAIAKNWTVVKEVIEKSAIALFEKMRLKLAIFDDLFNTSDNRICFSYDGLDDYDIHKRAGGFMLSTQLFPNSLTDGWLPKQPQWEEGLSNFGLEYYFTGYKLNKPFNLGIIVNMRFDKFTYSLTQSSTFTTDANYVEKNYGEQLTEEEIMHAVNNTAKEILHFLKKNEQF